jgi:sugar-specific transcriptional regulator TrmB/DNA-binding CsgD family transcriptional regulator
VLDALGLDASQYLVYRELVQLPAATAVELAAQMSMPPPDVELALSALEALGLVARSSELPDGYVASPPSIALSALLIRRRDDLRNAEAEVAALADLYRIGDRARTPTGVIDVVRGPVAVAQRFAQLHRAADGEVLGLVKAEIAVVAPEDNVDEDAAIARGVGYRIVVERRSFERLGYFGIITAYLEAGNQVRVTESVPIRMLIADRGLALVPLGASADDPRDGALLVHPSGLLDGLLALFELVWDSAAPVRLQGAEPRTDAANGLDDVDARVLTLLRVGLTDQAIGTQLQLSLRTVQRRVHGLMDRAGVRTRLQLGYEAARRGWLA